MPSENDAGGNGKKVEYFMGVDCGSGSVRVGICDSTGRLLAWSVEKISTNNPRVDYYEQSSDEIWGKVCKASKDTLAKAKDVTPEKIRGIGFDATCSLVVLDKKDRPLSVSIGESRNDDRWNIIMWRDHRAYKETDEINATNHEVLKYVGGQVSIEMETPKLMWLKRRKKMTFENAGKFMDLTDFLAYRATEVDVRSKCTLACKWTYLPHKAAAAGNASAGWSADFFKKIGLEELVAENYERIGQTVKDIGEKIGGLSEQAAKEMGLIPGTVVGVGLIDAHAGALGTLGAKVEKKNGVDIPLGRRMALICGTSTCHLTLSKEPHFVPGVWGPFADAVVGGYWVLEPGQSATGALMEFVVKSHWAYDFVQSEAERKGLSIFDLLNDHLTTMKDYRKQAEVYSKISSLPSVSGFEQPLACASSYNDAVRIKRAIKEAKNGRHSPGISPIVFEKMWKGRIAYLTKDFHCLPDYYGNRCPFADPQMRGMLTGLSVFNTNANTKSAGIDELSIRYLSVIQALAYSTRYILESLEAAGVPEVELLFMCGGVSKNPLFVSEHADITGRIIATPRDNETVLIGAATAGACAGGSFKSLEDAMKAMNHHGKKVYPEQDPALALYHERKYEVFRRLYKDHLAYRDIMRCKPTKEEDPACNVNCSIM